MQRLKLSEHDNAVLNSIFNPLLPIGEASFCDDFENCDLETKEGGEDGDEENGSEIFIPELREIQKRAIYETENKNYDKALKLFGEALKNYPNSAILLNDRAQCLRLAGLNEAAMKDLNLAIEISAKTDNRKIGTRSLCQRGIIFRKTGKLEEAKTDFTEASKRGSKFAKSQLVAINPYAAMCNQMLQEMTLKLSNPQQ